MSVLEFVASILRSLAWPLAALALVLIFRKKLNEWLSERPDEVELGPLKVKFQKKVAETIESIPTDVLEESVIHWSESTAAERQGDSVRREMDDLRLMAREQPEVSIILAFRAVESRLVSALHLRAPGVPRAGLTVRHLAESAVAAGVIAPSTGEAIRRLADLQNVANDLTGHIDEGKALDFLVIANSVIATIARDATLPN